MTAADRAAEVPQEGPAESRALYEAKARAELDAADKAVGSPLPWSGDPLARTVLVKGDPGQADVAAGRPLAGADGEAAAKALAALGVDAAAVLATISRPREAPRDALIRRLAEQIDAADPALVVALDAVAAEDVAEALRCPALEPGRPLRVRGRVLLAVDGLEASLGDPDRKARVWRQFRALGRMVATTSV